MRIAHRDHGRQDVVPRLRLHHGFVGEHAAVPADVAELLGRLAVAVAQPVAGVMGDVELAVGIGGQAMAAGLVVGAGAFDGRVVLGDVEIDRPGAQGGGQRRQGLVEFGSRLSSRILRAGCDLPARCSPACRAACGPCRPGSRRCRDGRSVRAAAPCVSNCACRPSRFLLRRRAARRNRRRCRRPRGTSRRSVF